MTFSTFSSTASLLFVSHVILGSLSPGTASVSKENSTLNSKSSESRKAPPTCAPNKFSCKSGECIHLVWKCDGQQECEDGSDEFDCGHSCAVDEFTCDNKQCVKKRDQCNETCELGNFACKNNKCIPQNWKCDGVDDCGDKSDESVKLCGNGSLSPGTASVGKENSTLSSKSSESRKETCELGNFACKNNKCILQDWKCDGVDDCGDNSDESVELCGNEMHTGPKVNSSLKEKIVIVVSCTVAFIVFLVIVLLFKYVTRKPEVSYSVQYIRATTAADDSTLAGSSLPSSYPINVESHATSMPMTRIPTDNKDTFHNRYRKVTDVNVSITLTAI